VDEVSIEKARISLLRANQAITSYFSTAEKKMKMKTSKQTWEHD
jgi:hypothetical protein